MLPDAFNRRVVGWALALRISLGIKALEMAVGVTYALPRGELLQLAGVRTALSMDGGSVAERLGGGLLRLRRSLIGPG